MRDAISPSSIAGATAAPIDSESLDRRTPSPQGRCHPHPRNAQHPRGKESNSERPGCVRGGRRPRRHWAGCESGAARRQCYRPVDQTADLGGKRLDLLRDVIPNLRRVGVMANVDNPANLVEVEDIRTAAGKQGVDVVTSEIRRAEDIAPAIDAIKGRVDALYVIIDPLVITNRVRMSTLAIGARLPTISGFREAAEAGGLISYAASFPDLFRRSADYVDKILRGAKPGDLPVEQPTKFELVVNLTTAKVLGRTIPESFLLRADEVIE